MGVNKKGQLYLFISSIFVLSIFLLYFSTQAYNYKDAQDAVSKRIGTINDFIEDLDNDMKKATFIASFRALIAIEEEIALTGDYFPNVESLFKEAFFNGTLNGINKTILNTSSFSDYLNRVSQISSDVGIILDIKVKNVTMYHEEPWSVSVNVTFSNNVTDVKGAASWYYEKVQKTEVTIIDLRDPFYSVGTLNRAPNVIKKTNLTPFINDVGDVNDTTNLIIHSNESLYFASASAPDYVMRLKGNFSNSTYGIESLVNILELISQGAPVDTTETIVDYIFFNPNSSSTDDVCSNFINMSSWFKIDRPHLSTYEIDPKLGPEDEGYTCT